MTAMTAGIYLLTASVRFDANNTGARELFFERQRSGGPPADFAVVRIGASAAPGLAAAAGQQTATALAYFNQYDIVYTQVFQDSGANRTVLSSDTAFSPTRAGMVCLA